MSGNFVRHFLFLIKMKYVKSLDGIRALAIILVMLFHFNYFLEVGWIGVQLFFVLSGYLITSILLQEKQHPLGFYLKRFYWRRSLRIFPIYYCYIFAVLAGFFLFHYPADLFSYFPYLMSYTYNYYPLADGLKFDTLFTHFWSLSVEEQFYIFWPILIYVFSPKQLKVLLIVIIAGSPLFRYVLGEAFVTNELYSHDVGEIIYRMLPSQLDGFAFGALIPVFGLSNNHNMSTKLLYFVIVLCVLVGLVNYLTLDSKEVNISSLGFPIGSTVNLAHVWSYTVINILSTAMILLLLIGDTSSWINRLFSNAVLVRIGQISYGLYVYHWIIFHSYRKFLGKYIGNDVLSFLLYFVICFVISELSFRLLESYFIKMKGKRFMSHEK